MRVTLSTIMTNGSDDDLEVLLPKEIIVPISVNLDNYENIEMRPCITDTGDLDFSRTYFEFGNYGMRSQVIFNESFDKMKQLITKYEEERISYDV